MSKNHSKKRNTGLLYEFLVRTVAKSLVEGKQRTSTVALRIVRRHFKPGSELYKEFRLFNSLVKTTVSSEAVAASILSEAKAAARSYNARDLDRQKSLLIRDINHVINDENFYDQPIESYRMFATIQTLLNDWRNPNADLQRLALYEDNLIKWLTTEKDEVSDQALNEESPGNNRLLMKVMMKKLNEKYSGVLNDEQRSLIRAYAFSTASDDPDSLKLKLAEIKDKLLKSIDDEISNHGNNTTVIDKLVEARACVFNELLVEVDDDTVTRFMLYTKLASELSSEESNEI